MLCLSLLFILFSFGMHKQSLTLLLCLEFLVLFIILGSMLPGTDMFFGLMMVCIGACEGAVGLSCLISMTRVKDV